MLSNIYNLQVEFTLMMLSLGPVCIRLAEQFVALKQYFLVSIKQNNKICTSNARYNRMVAALQDRTFEAKIHFIVSVPSVFDKFERFFQTEGPRVHLLYTHPVV